MSELRALACVKRVPAPGAQITLTADARAVDARNLAFTTSPHEECAVEEAIRLVEAHGGDITVLTVGPPEAEEQLRFSISVGAQHAVLATNDRIASGEDPDPQATAHAIVEAVRELEARDGAFDILLFGNESADAGGYQVGVRVARALGRPMVNGIKAIDVADGVLTARRESDAGFEVYQLALPAVVGVKEGINLPRYPTLPGRLRSKKAEIETIGADAPAGGLTMIRFEAPVIELTETEILGTGADAAGPVVDLIYALGLGVNPILVLIDHDRGTVDEASLQTLTFARETISDAPVGAVIIGGDSVPALAGADVIWHIRHAELSDYAPEAWGDALHQLAADVQPPAIMATGTERGNEVLAHLAAIADEPFAANVVRATAPNGDPGSPWEIRRTRWGGSLLEDATLTALLPIMSAALHAYPVPAARESDAAVREFTPALGPEAARTRVVDRVQVAEGITLTTAPVVVSGGRGVGSEAGFAAIEELAELLGAAVGCSRVVTNQGWRPHADQVGQTGKRVAPDLYIACGISGAIQHWVGMQAAKHVLAINTDPDAPMVTKADYAAIGDLHEIVPAIVAELRRRRS